MEIDLWMGAFDAKQFRNVECDAAHRRRASPKGFTRPEVATTRRSFTFFEVCDINFAIIVYSECMHVDVDLHEATF
jgi:hypothetical protein